MKVAVGIDIGGTNTKFGIVDREGTVFYRDRIKTAGHDSFETYFELLSKNIKKGLDLLDFKYELMGVGVGAPNGNYYKGTIENAPNLPWHFKIELSRILQEEFNVTSLVTNDANAAAIGEMIYGGAKGMKDFIVITLGTGLGSGIVSNGELINGHDGYAGELGHVLAKHKGRQCACGKQGCLETYVSATGIRRTVYKFLADDLRPSVLRDVSFNELSTKMISEAALKGDLIAQRSFEYTGEILGMRLADAVAHTSPEAIFLFGGLAKAKELIFEPTKRHLEANLLSFYRNHVKILPSQLGDETAPILGSSSLIWKNLEQ